MDGEQQKEKQSIETPSLQANVSQQIKCYFIKSNFFRVIHADGVWGGVTPHMNIQMSFFSERTPIPKVTTAQVTPSGIKEINKETKIGIIREVEVDVIMDLETAKALRFWLDEKIQAMDRLKSGLEQGTVKIVTSYDQQAQSEDTAT